MRTGRRYGIVSVCVIVSALLLLLFVMAERDVRIPAAREEGRESRPVAVRVAPAPAADPISIEPPRLASADDSAASDATTVVLRDLRDGAPISGLRVACTWEAATKSEDGVRTTIVSDDAGRLTVPRRGLKTLVPEDATWTLPKQDLATIRAAGVAWLYRTMVVCGHVRVEPPNPDHDFTQVSLAADSSGPGSSHEKPSTMNSDVWSYHWLRIHGVVSPSQWLAPPSKEGRFQVEVPCVRGMAITAQATGYRKAWAILESTGDLRVDGVSLVLRRSFRVSGVLRDPQGKPLRGASIRGYVTMEGLFGDLDPERLGLTGQGGYTAVRSQKEDYSRVTYTAVPVQTDADGRFSLEMKSDGRVLVIAYPEGHRPARIDAGFLSDESGDLDITAVAVTERRSVQFKFAGVPLRQAPVVIADLDETEQPALTYMTDEEGSLPAEWFEEGRLYGIIPMASVVPLEHRRSHFLRWKEAEEVDLRDVSVQRPKELDSPKRRR